MADARIVRNRAKILAAITNARATLRLRDKGGLVDFVWSFRPDRTPAPRTVAEIPTKSSESLALSKALRKVGFTFVGPTTMYALMEAIGLVDTHLVDSHRRGTSGVWARTCTCPDPGGTYSSSLPGPPSTFETGNLACHESCHRERP